MAEDRQEQRQAAERQRRMTYRDIKTQRYYYLPCAVARLRTLRSGAKLLYAVLRTLAGDSDVVNVGANTLAKMTSRYVFSVRKWCRRLECQGLIQIEHGQACNQYSLLPVDKPRSLIRLDGRVLSRTGLIPTEKLLLCYIAWQQRKGGWCRQSHQKIAAELGLDRSAVWYIARRLKAAGEIEVQQKPGRGGPINYYRVIMAADKQRRHQAAERQLRATARDIETDRSYYLPCAVARLTTLTSGAKLLYAVLKTLAWDSDVVSVSAPTLAEMIGGCQELIFNWCRRLECQGLIKIMNDRRCSRYSLLPVDEGTVFIRLDGDVLARRGLGHSEKLLLCYLSWLQGDNPCCRPMQKEIGSDLGLSIPTVSSTANKLKAAGIIQFGCGLINGQARNWYRVT